MNKYKPSIVTLMQNQKPWVVVLGLTANLTSHFIMALANVIIFSLAFKYLGFWYSVAFFTVLRVLFYVIGQASKYQMEQEIMKGGGK